MLLLIQPVNRPTIPRDTISAFIPIASFREDDDSGKVSPTARCATST